MAKFWTVFRREYLERVRSKWFVIATVFGPALIAVFMFVPPWLTSRSMQQGAVGRIAIVDATGTDLGQMIAAELSGGITGDTTLVRVVSVPARDRRATERELTPQVVSGRIRGFLVLDENTIDRFAAHYHGRNASSAAEMRELSRVVRDNILARRLSEAGVDAATGRALATARMSFDAQRVTGTGRTEAGQVSVFFAAGVALLLYLSIFMYGQNVLRGVMEEKQSRVAEVVVSSVSPGTLLAGKIGGVGAVGLTQMLIWVGSSLALFRARNPILSQFGLGELPMRVPQISWDMGILLLVFFTLGYIFYAALFAIVGSMVSNEQDAQQAQLPVVMLLVSSIFLLGPILANPEGGIGYTMGWIPFSSPIIMPLRMSVASLSPVDIGAALLILACSCYIAIWMAARIYRVGLLMYGKRPTIRETARWLRRTV